MFIEYRQGLYINSNAIQSIELDDVVIKFRIKDGRDRVMTCTNQVQAGVVFDQYIAALNHDPTIEILRNRIHDLEKTVGRQQEQIEQLHQMILYQPGGQMYQIGQASFNANLELQRKL